MITINFKSTIANFEQKIEELKVVTQKLTEENAQLKKEQEAFQKSQMEHWEQLEKLTKDKEMLLNQIEHFRLSSAVKEAMYSGLRKEIMSLTAQQTVDSGIFEYRIAREMEKAEYYKKQCELLRNQLSEEPRVSGSAPKASVLPMCEICVRPFDNECPDLIPRALSCGHTLCEECCGRLLSGPNETFPTEHISCPFDRSMVLLGKRGVLALPKNFTVTQIIEEVKKQ